MSFLGLQKRLEKRIENLSPDSKEMREAFLRIGLVLTSQMKLNLRRVVYSKKAFGYVRTGNLLNSIKYEFFKDGDTGGIVVGSFGVPYAAVIEYGFSGNQTVKSFMRNQTTAFGKRLDPPKKVNVKSHSRNIDRKAKPYLRPAIEKHQNFIIQTLREVLSVRK